MFIANLRVQVIGTGGGGGKKKKGRGAPGRVYESHEDPGWESEVRTREEEVAAYEERIMIKEFRERLAFNLNKVGPAWGGSSQYQHSHTTGHVWLQCLLHHAILLCQS